MTRERAYKFIMFTKQRHVHGKDDDGLTNKKLSTRCAHDAVWGRRRWSHARVLVTKE